MKKKVFIAGGGTGGHIYPGLALAEVIQKKYPDWEIEFVGTKEGLEGKIISKTKFRLHLIQGGKLNFSGQPFKKLKTLLLLPFGFLQSLFLLLRRQDVQAVIGVGGYASGPFVLMATLLGKKTVIWEANAMPGMTNRWLGRWVDSCYIVFEKSLKHLPKDKCHLFGIPTRGQLQPKPKLVRSGPPFRLLHFGGSQGSRAIGTALKEAIVKFPEAFQNIEVIHQTGAVDFHKFKEAYQSAKTKVEVHEFLYQINEQYEWCDLVVCRGGASTLNEVAAYGLPALVIPLPAADGHQEENANALRQAGAVEVLLQKDLTPESLRNAIQSLLSDEEKLKSMSQKVRGFYKEQAAEKIVEHLFKGDVK